MSWVLDKAHSEVTFSVRHMMLSTVRGRFPAFDATVTLDPEHPERSSVNASLDVASLTTGQADRDAHLKSPDFFDVANHPRITFASRQATPTGDGQFDLVGDLTIRDVTREVTLRGEFEGPLPHIRGGRAVGFSLQGEIDREAFGLTWNMPLPAGGVLVSKSVKIAIEAEVMEPAAVSPV